MEKKYNDFRNTLVKRQAPCKARAQHLFVRQ